MRLPGLTLIATYRPDELTSRLPGGEMLVRLERRRRVHQIHLERLDHAEVGAFVSAVYGRTVGTRVVDALRNRTGGNPFFLEEILAAAGDVEPEALAEQPLPWTLAEVVSAQLDGLSTDQRRVVETAAVLGSRAPFDVLAVLAGRSEDELIADLRSLGRARTTRRGSRRRVQLPARVGPRRRGEPAARPRTPSAPRAVHSMRCDRPCPPTSPTSPATPPAPGATTRWSSSPARGSRTTSRSGRRIRPCASPSPA